MPLNRLSSKNHPGYYSRKYGIHINDGALTAVERDAGFYIST